MVASLSAQDQLAGLMATSMPEEILKFKFNTNIQERILVLTNKKKENKISINENE